MNNRILFLIAILFSLFLQSAIGFAASINIGSKDNVQQGDTIQIPVSIDAATDIAGVNVRMDYDPDAFCDLAVSAGALLDGSHVLDHHGPFAGRFNVVAYAPQGVDVFSAKSGTVFTISMKVKETATAGGEYHLAFASPTTVTTGLTFASSGLSDLSGNSIEHDPSPGQVTIVDISEGRSRGDFDDSGCTDINDFLFLLDNWQMEVYGETIGINDFLALLDNWQQGTNCKPLLSKLENATISIDPSYLNVAVGEPISVTVEVDTAGESVRGGAVVLLFDSAVLEVNGGAAGVTKAEGSPFNLTPSPSLGAGRLEIPLLEPSFNQVAYSGAVAHFTFNTLSSSSGTTVSYDETVTRFSPDLAYTQRQGATYSVGEPILMPIIRIEPATHAVKAGEPISVTVEVDTAGESVRGGAVVLLFDSAVLEVNGGAAGVKKAEGSPFDLTPSPSLGAGRLEIPLLEPSFNQVAYSGAVAHFTFNTLSSSSGTTVSYDETVTRFSPDLAYTQREGATYVIEGMHLTPTASPTQTAVTPTASPTITVTVTTTPTSSATPSQTPNPTGTATGAPTDTSTPSPTSQMDYREVFSRSADWQQPMSCQDVLEFIETFRNRQRYSSPSLTPTNTKETPTGTPTSTATATIAYTYTPTLSPTSTETPLSPTPTDTLPPEAGDMNDDGQVDGRDVLTASIYWQSTLKPSAGINTDFTGIESSRVGDHKFFFEMIEIWREAFSAGESQQKGRGKDRVNAVTASSRPILENGVVELDLDPSTSSIDRSIVLQPGEFFDAHLVIQDTVNMTGVTVDVAFDAIDALDLIEIKEVPGDLNFDGQLDLLNEIMAIENQYRLEIDFINTIEDFVDGYGRNSSTVYDTNANNMTDYSEVLSASKEYWATFNFEETSYWTREMLVWDMFSESMEVFPIVNDCNVGGRSVGLIDNISAVLLKRQGRTEPFIGFTGDAIVVTLTFKVKNEVPEGEYEFSFPEAFCIDSEFETTGTIMHLHTPATLPKVVVVQ